MKRIIKYIPILLFLSLAREGEAQFITNNGIKVTNNSEIFTNGDWKSDASSVLVNNGVIHTSESFVNDGTLDNTGVGGFILLYTSDLAFKPGGSSINFLKKDGSGKALVNGTIAIQDSLILLDGILETVDATDTIAARSNALVLASPTSFVEGLMARSGTGNLQFPVGKDGYSMPITIYQANVKKATASVIDIANGISPGPGVDSLINFPYAWKMQEEVVQDTASFIEVSYPNTLPFSSIAIIAKEIPGNKLAGMGSRFRENKSGTIKIKSYGRGLKGVFTIAAGFGGDPAEDSITMVALYNATNGPAWTNSTNWLSNQPIDTWHGISRTGQTITAVDLSDNKLTGTVPLSVAEIPGLSSINLSGNNLSSIPDFSKNSAISLLDVSGNDLGFGSLEPNASVTGLVYTGQHPFGSPLDLEIEVGSEYNLSQNAGGNNTTYQWKRSNSLVNDATSPDLFLSSIDRSTMGDYVLEAKNPLLPDLTLTSRVQKIRAYAEVSGKLMITNSTSATAGKMTLFRIAPGGFDTVAIKSILNDGSFVFDKVILDDYQLLGFADTIVHTNSIPTYYKNTIFWQEADTLVVEDNQLNLQITSAKEPEPPSGPGQITGVLTEEDGSGRISKTKAPKRVANAGVAVRRVERSGRNKDSYALVAYAFTNDQGEFSFRNLPADEYRIDIQYPGYPMDTTSDIIVKIETGLKSQAEVAASVSEGQIHLKKLLITGFNNGENYQAEIFPNPAVNAIHLKFGKDAVGRKVSIIDDKGQSLMTGSAEGSESVISLENFISGIYLLRIEEKGKVVKTAKVILK
jgi:hypothetical protein